MSASDHILGLLLLFVLLVESFVWPSEEGDSLRWFRAPLVGGTLEEDEGGRV